MPYESIARERQLLGIDPQFWYAHITIASCLTAMGRYADAVRELRVVPEEYRDYVSAFLGNALALAGHREEATALLRKVVSTGPDDGDRWVHGAYIQVGLGDKLAALTSLENSLVHHETDANYIGVDPILDPLRNEPRFQALLKKLGL